MCSVVSRVFGTLLNDVERRGGVGHARLLILCFARFGPFMPTAVGVCLFVSNVSAGGGMNDKGYQEFVSCV